MAISVVQSAVISVAAWSGTFGANVTAGNTVFLVASGYTGSNTTITSSSPLFAGSTPSGSAKLLEESYAWDGTATDYTAAWMMPNVAGGSNSVALTVTGSDANGNIGLIGYEVAGLGGTPSLDKSAGTTGFTTSPSSGSSGAVTGAPEFILGMLVQDGTLSPDTPPGTPWTSLGASGGNNACAGYQIAASSGGAYTYSAATSANTRWCAGVATVAVASTLAPAGNAPSTGVPLAPASSVRVGMTIRGT